MGYDCDARPGSGLWLGCVSFRQEATRIPIPGSFVVRRTVAADRSFKQSLQSLRTDLGLGATPPIAMVVRKKQRLTPRQSAMKIKPIRTEKDHEAALVEIEKLWGAQEGTPRGDRLDVLITLVEAYEQSGHPIDAPDPIEAIRFRLEQLGEDHRALVGVIGNRSRVHEVLNGQRGLSLAMIRRLHQEFGIPAEVLIRPSRAKDRRPAA